MFVRSDLADCAAGAVVPMSVRAHEEIAAKPSTARGVEFVGTSASGVPPPYFAPALPSAGAFSIAKPC